MSSQKLLLIIPPELRGKRLDQALAVMCPQHSRARLQAWIRDGLVHVDRRAMKQRDTVSGGESVEIVQRFEGTGDGAEAENIPLTVLHEDADLIIIDKPAGLVVHPGAGNPRHTLMNALLHHAPELRRVPRAGIIQRLDKDTSGIMVIARTPETHTLLTARLKQRAIRRMYIAIVHGFLTAGGSVDAPVGRHPVGRTRMAVVPAGRSALTHYRVIKRVAGCSVLRVTLETGRTHQIRVHMAHLHHPLVGDPLYGGRRLVPGGVSAQVRDLIRTFPRQALHASELGLDHPRSGKPVSYTAPLPADMRGLLSALEHET